MTLWPRVRDCQKRGREWTEYEWDASSKAMKPVPMYAPILDLPQVTARLETYGVPAHLRGGLVELFDWLLCVSIREWTPDEVRRLEAEVTGHA